MRPGTRSTTAHIAGRRSRRASSLLPGRSAPERPRASLSSYPLERRLVAIEREYWCRAWPPCGFPPEPSVLRVSSAAATHPPLHRLTQPLRLVTAIGSRPRPPLRRAGAGSVAADLAPYGVYCWTAELCRRRSCMPPSLLLRMEGRAPPTATAARPLVQRCCPLGPAAATLVVTRIAAVTRRSQLRMLRRRFESVMTSACRRDGENS